MELRNGKRLLMYLNDSIIKSSLPFNRKYDYKPEIPDSLLP